LTLKLIGDGIEPGHTLVVPAEVIVPETSSVAVTEISAVLVHPFVVPVTVNVVETIGLTLAIPNELLGVDKTYCAGDQEYVVAPVAESDAVSPMAIVRLEPATKVCGPWVTEIKTVFDAEVTDPEVATRR
jgi:hypothetical protein